MRRSPIALLFLLLPFKLLAQPVAVANPPREAPAEVMIVGTYHFSNPGQDQHNVKSDDVLTPARQRQLQAIAKGLMRFHPTLVAVEWPADQVEERYAKFRTGTLPPSRNEVVQLGFRLAGDAGIASVHGINADGDFPYEPVQAWAQQNGAADRLAAMQDRIEASANRLTELQHNDTIAAALREMNKPETITEDHAAYADLMRYGSGNEQPGVKLLAAWQTRNL